MPTRSESPRERAQRRRPAVLAPAAVAGAMAFLLGACAAHRPPLAPTPLGAGGTAAPAGPASPTDAELARAAIAATTPRTPVQLVFDWKLRDRDARFSGQGVARIEAPYRARLDLFGPRGESYLSAAIVDASLRVPEALRERAAMVPPPALLWSALGVVAPPADGRLTGVRRSGGETRLEYLRGDERWRFTLVDQRLRSAELDRPGAARQAVELKGTGALGLPKQAVFRDYATFRELTLTLDRAHEAQSFPPDIWSPGAP
jgi:hypothetical protein